MSTPAPLIIADRTPKRDAPPAVAGGDNANSFVAMIARAAADPTVDVLKMLQLVEMRDRELKRIAEEAFNEALSDAQQEMRPVAADAENPQTRSRYASYAALDRAIRPIYTRHGFSLSFDEGDTTKPDHIRVLCYVARGGYSRTYKKDIAADGKGAKGGDVMTKTHASGAAGSYGMRYLLRMIFNIAVGEDDTDGNAGVECISDGQVADLSALLSDVGASKDALLSWLKLERLADIPADRYSAVVRAVEGKRKTPAKQPTQVRR